jgi:two-component system OmpR family response regulator
MSSDRPLILVSDPDCESVAMISRQLLWAGYDVVTAGTGGDALEVLNERPVDGAVLEVMLGDVSGYEIVRRMRSDAARMLTPIVLISARAGKLDRDFAFTVGADDYVKKPFHSSELVARLALLVPTLEPKPATKPKPTPPLSARPMRRRPTPVPAFAR